MDSDAVPESIHQDLCQKIKGLFIHGSIFNNLHFVGNDPLKLNNAIKAFLINLNIILYHILSLNIYEYSKCHHYQYYYNQLKNHTRIYLTHSYYLNVGDIQLLQNLFL